MLVRHCQRVTALYVACLLVLTVVGFAPLGHLDLDLHDAEMLRDHQAIASDFSFFFSEHREQATGRPLAELIKWLGFAVWGANIAAFHYFVVALHTIASLLLAWLCYRLDISPSVALATGLLFLVNVSHYQAVHHISALGYPLAAIWTWLAIWCYTHSAKTDAAHKWRWFYAGVLLAGVLTHIATLMVLPIAAFTLPFVALTTQLTPTETSTQRAVSTLFSVNFLSNAMEMAYALIYFLGRLIGMAHSLPIPSPPQPRLDVMVGICLIAVLALAPSATRSSGPSRRREDAHRERCASSQQRSRIPDRAISIWLRLVLH
ncbi:MAG TPA: hypothetical protein EYG11_21085 [Candidatus Latescibacteria bacterium]|nr:hypothetical protein [Candidatus Handelsmanbacteria bacterium]HIL11199.1 hypothetical protein [Candidatus Latescibacterota bacterium]